ncbi:FadR family transcriptional regulator [Actinomadura graeca]|uniref:FadR family transcriptional regulator n=1 Tax=Actinomadura graeca TaxID=2750812 RepID=A0ABX8QZ16_9ACTN|nr:FadR family transcriptional regulator [Actinomadura graeca]
MSDVLRGGPVALRPVPGGSTVDAVLDQLQAQVSGGAWPVGGRIPAETELAARLGVSRPAVREAIRALSHVGMLEVRRGDGTYVRSSADPRPLLRRVTRATARDVFEVQLAYDVQAARLAARRRTDADLARLEELLRARDEATEADEFGAADGRFHLGIAEATRNPVLIEAMRFFIGRLQETMRTIRLDHEVPEAGPARHRAVLDAIAAGDPIAAGEAAAAVVEPSLAILETLVARASAPGSPEQEAPSESPLGEWPVDGPAPAHGEEAGR